MLWTLHRHLRRARFSLALVAGFALAGATSNSQAAVVAFSDFAAFNAAAAAAGGTADTITFDSLTPGSTLSTVGDVSFFVDDGELLVLDTFPETISGPNYIGDNGGFNFSEQFDEGQTITFTFGAARSAVGVFVQYDPTIITNDGTLSLFDFDSGVMADVDGLGIPLDTTIGGASDRAFFIGLVQTDGTNTLTETDLFVSDFGEIGFTFDNLVTYQVTAIPEPSGILAVVAVAGGWGVRRRFKKNAAKV